MTKYEWVKKEVEGALKEFPPDTRKYIDAFLKEVGKVGEGMSRIQFFEILDKCRPKISTDYFNYSVLDDHFSLADNFKEAWTIPAVKPLPCIKTKSVYGRVKLPDDFCTIGGTPKWIQNVTIPICDKCDGDMVLFVQLKSLPYKITEKREELDSFKFGDAGNFYVFCCPECKTYKVSSECY